MQAAINQLFKIQKSVSARNSVSGTDEKLLFCPVDDGLHLEFYGLAFDEFFEEFVQTLCSPELAPIVKSLVFRGPDDGANGTRNWDFTRLLENDASFPHLNSLVVEPSSPEHHNQTIIASSYDEEGQIARLLVKMPVLKYLTVPSAPDETFFEIGFRPLTYLRVESGYDTQNFISNFSQSNCFSKLQTLDFSDYNQREMEDYPASCTPFEDYQKLFQSQAFAGVRKFFLRNSPLSLEQLRELRKLKEDCQLLVLQTPRADYIR